MPAINWSNFTDFGQLPEKANEASSGSFWVGAFYMVWVILIFAFISFGFEVAIVVSTFLAMVIGILLVYANLMAWEHLVSVVALLLFMFLYIIWSTSKNK